MNGLSSREKAVVMSPSLADATHTVILALARRYNEIVSGEHDGKCTGCPGDRSREPGVWPFCTPRCRTRYVAAQRRPELFEMAEQA